MLRRSLERTLQRRIHDPCGILVRSFVVVFAHEGKIAMTDPETNPVRRIEPEILQELGEFVVF